MNPSHPDPITPYPDINQVLQALKSGMQAILGNNLLGLYLFGSLSYGDFNPHSSDIDLTAIISRPLSPEERESVKRLHQQVGEAYPHWANRLECSYTPVDMLQHRRPPEQPRPYIGEGVFYPDAHYGNEWMINLYLLYEHGVTLLGPDFKTLVAPIAIEEVQKACIRDLFREWEPKITDPAWLDNSHYQSYLILNLCRILYTVLAKGAGSKKVAAAWVKHQFGEWSDLIQAAEQWHYGTEMRRREESIAFIRFAVVQVQNSPLFTVAMT